MATPSGGIGKCSSIIPIRRWYFYFCYSLHAVKDHCLFLRTYLRASITVRANPWMYFKNWILDSKMAYIQSNANCSPGAYGKKVSSFWLPARGTFYKLSPLADFYHQVFIMQTFSLETLHASAAMSCLLVSVIGRPSITRASSVLVSYYLLLMVFPSLCLRHSIFHTLVMFVCVLIKIFSDRRQLHIYHCQNPLIYSSLTELSYLRVFSNMTTVFIYEWHIWHFLLGKVENSHCWKRMNWMDFFF